MRQLIILLADLAAGRGILFAVPAIRVGWGHQANLAIEDLDQVVEVAWPVGVAGNLELFSLNSVTIGSPWETGMRYLTFQS